MSRASFYCSLCFGFCSFLLFLLRLITAQEGLQTYIVQLHPPNGATKPGGRRQWHLSFLERAILTGEGENPSSRILYSYHTAMDGFSARLSPTELTTLRAHPGVAAVRPDHRIELTTTYSYQFLGLGGPSSNYGGFKSTASHSGAGAIVGVLDTGVWPESPSFRDDGMPPVPTRWRGVCQPGEGFNSSSCNRKLIGARYYSKGHRSSSSSLPHTTAVEYASPRDAHGHGTHTASTAAGTLVRGASVLGLGAGDARGVAPGARVAVYKVCWFSGCYSSDILAGMDDAVRDGVDVLSLSLGGFPIPLFEDSIAIGGFRAMERGVVVVCAAGNNGPVPYSVANGAPWLTTVGASTLDRRFPAFLKLGNGKTLYGESMYPGNKHSSKGGVGGWLDLVYVTGGGDRGSELCFKGSLPKPVVTGTMVVCDRGVNGRAEKGQAVKESGGAAMVLANADINLEEDSVDVHVLPATAIGYKESLLLKRYINSTLHPVARIIFGGTRLRRARAPSIAIFSARGPSLASPAVLKPDVVAPGVNIIAAWPQNLGPSGLREDSRRSEFSVLSGTSMACPHASGAVAVVKAAHPDWSPAMVRSAILTTAETVDRYGKPILDGDGGFAGSLTMGAGHISPVCAVNPGLVYDIRPDEYVAHLCAVKYTESEIYTITHRNASCGGRGSAVASKQNWTATDLNYPSITVEFKKGGRELEATAVVRRRVTNVGPANSTYIVRVASPPGIKVKVMPRKLEFGAVGESGSYRVWLQTSGGTEWKKVMDGVKFAEGHLTWVRVQEQGGQAGHRVRSPLLVTWSTENGVRS